MIDALLNIDNQIIVFLNSLGSEQWDTFWLFITDPKHWFSFLFICLFLLIRAYGVKKACIQVLAIAAICIVALGLVTLIKNGVERLRPNNTIAIAEELRSLLNPQDFSFVSGHATVSFTLTVLLYKLLKKQFKSMTLVLLFIFPVLFAYSRLYLGLHFLSDIIAGAALGVTIANLGWYCIKRTNLSESPENRLIDIFS